MKIIGWIREGDKAACGGTVVEGDPNCTGEGVAYSFQGARIACRKNCVIAGGFTSFTLTNGRAKVIHGMLTSSGCPLLSTLNGRDGVGNDGGEEIHPAFALDGNGGWKGIYPPPQEHDKAYDEYFIVIDDKSGTPARNRFYRMTLDTGEILEGHTDEEGRTQYAKSDTRIVLTLDIAPQHEIQIGD
jgi:uncharacterized Zn-binding protein involved in type VI secretion